MKHRDSERRIIYSLFAGLIAIQLAIYFVLRVNDAQIARSNLDETLTNGSLVTRSLLETRQKQLDESTRVLAGDFGLREAIATNDRPTIASMLDNHEKRAQGLFVAVHDLSQRLLAKSANLPVGQRLDALQLDNERSGGTPIKMAALDLGGETLFHMSTAEVKAPQRVAWISMGFAINTSFAEELTKLTGLQFMFVARDQQGAWRMHGSTLPPSVTAAAMRDVRTRRIDDLKAGSWTIEVDHDTFLLSAMSLSALGTGEVAAVMGRSLDRAMEPLRQSERALLALIAVSLFVGGGVIWWVTAHMVAPINESAHRDTLTGLVNRRYFDATLQLAVEDADRKGRSLSVLMMDLNKFKQINDQLGHAAGDEVLQVVGKRLQQGFRATDTVARLGGDEFAVILPGVGRQQVTSIVEGVVKRICEPFPLGGRPTTVGTSIGIAMSPDDGSTAAVLLERADKAMYTAKTGGIPFAFFEATHSMMMEEALAVPRATLSASAATVR